MLDTQFPLLLHSFVQDTPPEPDGLWNVPHLWRTAAEQNLLPVLAYENKRWKLFDDPNVCRQLDGLLYGTVATNLNRCVDFETLSASFTEHGIAHMPVKGYYLRKLYPTPELRTFGDIDLLIHPEDRQKVHNLMLSLGYTVKQDWEPTYSYIKDAEYYEIHTNLMDGNLDGRTDLQAYLMPRGRMLNRMTGFGSVLRMIFTLSTRSATWPNICMAAERGCVCIWMLHCM